MSCLFPLKKPRFIAYSLQKIRRWSKWKPQIFIELQKITDDTVCWSMTHIQMCGCFIHCHAAVFLHDDFNCCNGLWCHYLMAWLGRSRRTCQSTRALAVVTDMLHHTGLSFIDEFRRDSPLRYAVLRCKLQAGRPSLHYYCAVVLYSCIVLPPVGNSSNHE
jgi:hypothetical protein